MTRGARIWYLGNDWKLVGRAGVFVEVIRGGVHCIVRWSNGAYGIVDGSNLGVLS